MATRTSDTSSLGDALLCPVCLVMYEGRILQCSQGHAVCEKCQLKLTECPHCRGMYMGTRNYVLEDVIDKLKKLEGSSILGGMKKQTPGKSTNEAPLNADIIPLPVANSMSSSSNGTVTPPVALHGLLRLFDEFLFDENTFLNTAEEMRNAAPLQAKGLYACRMIGCTAVLPVCRMLNHIRYYHKSLLVRPVIDTENPQNDVDLTVTLMPSQNKCLALNIPKFGLFFLLWNVHPALSNAHTLTSWVQCVCPNNAARAFRFTMSLDLGDSTVTYSDFVYGAQSTEAYIRQKKQCLTVNTNNMSREALLKLTIGRTIGSRSVPRHSRSVQTIRVVAGNPTVRGRRGRGRGRRW